MSDAIDQAAQAFQADMGGGSAPSRSGSEAKPAPELVFGGSDTIENPGEAGGDGLPSPIKAKTDKPAKKRAKESEEEIDPAVLEEFGHFGDLEDDGQDEGDDVDEDDQDEGNDVDGDEDEDEDAKSEKDDEDDEEMDREFTVMVDGEEETVTLREALNGYSRTKTFYTRMNQLHQAKTELIGFAENLNSKRQQTEEMYSEAEELLQGVLPPEPDWDKLYAEDAKAAREVQKQYDALKGNIEGIRQKRAELAQRKAEEEARETAEFAKKEFARFSNAAKWKSQKDVKKDLDSMRRTALAVGFTPEEVATVYDSRMLTVLLKASKYDRMMAAKPKQVSRTSAGPGARNGNRRAAQKGFDNAKKKLSRTGSVEDAAAVFAKILE